MSILTVDLRADRMLALKTTMACHLWNHMSVISLKSYKNQEQDKMEKNGGWISMSRSRR
jgi:hypothetical protein